MQFFLMPYLSGQAIKVLLLQGILKIEAQTQVEEGMLGSKYVLYTLWVVEFINIYYTEFIRMQLEKEFDKIKQLTMYIRNRRNSGKMKALGSIRKN